MSESLDGLTGNLSLLTDHDHVELETTLQELVLNLLRDGVETDVGVGTYLFSGGHGERTRSGRLKREERTAGRRANLMVDGGRDGRGLRRRR